MNSKQTIVWRMMLLGLFASMVPLGLLALDWHWRAGRYRGNARCLGVDPDYFTCHHRQVR